MANELRFTIIGKDEFSGVISKLNSDLPSLKTLAIAAAGGVAAAGGALAAMAASAATVARDTGLMSQKIGISTEELSKYKAAAELVGIEQDFVTDGLKEITLRMAEAQTGTGAAYDALTLLGVGMDEVAGKTPDQQMEIFADALQQVSDQGERVFLAEELMGEAGSQLLPILNDGAEGLRAMKEEGARFGTVIGEDAAKAGLEFAEAYNKIQLVLQSLKDSIGLEVMPTFTGFGTLLAEMIADNKQTILDFADKAIGALAAIGKVGLYSVAGLIDTFYGLKTVLVAIEYGWANLVEAMINGLLWLSDQARVFIEKFNFKGIFDGLLESMDEGKSQLQSFSDFVGTTTDVIGEDLENLMNRESAVGQVNDFVSGITEGLEELKNKSTETKELIDATWADGAGPFSLAASTKAAEATEEQKTALDNLAALHDQYFMSDAERLQQWYDEQQAIIGDNQEAQLELEAVHGEMLMELQSEQYEALSEMKDEQTLTDSEKEDLWYQEELAKLQQHNMDIKNAQGISNAQRLAMLDANEKAQENLLTIHTNNKKAIEDLYRTETLNATVDFLSGAAALSEQFGKRGVRLAKVLGIAQSTISMFQGAAEALKLPFPANLAAAATVLAQGATLVAGVKSVGTAHSGEDFVRREGMYMLSVGEGVLTAEENRKRRAGTDTGGGQTVGTQEINVSVLPNATNVDSMLSMDYFDWLNIVESKIVPALRTLNTQGVTI